MAQVVEPPSAACHLASFSRTRQRTDHGTQHPQTLRCLPSPRQSAADQELRRPFTALAHDESLDRWVAALPPSLADGVQTLIEPQDQPLPRRHGAKVPDSLTYQRTAGRTFEVSYWKTIASLAEGKYLNKNNADCIRDANTQRELPYFDRRLDGFGDYLLSWYDKQIAAAKLKGHGWQDRYRCNGRPISTIPGWVDGS